MFDSFEMFKFTQKGVYNCMNEWMRMNENIFEIKKLSLNVRLYQCLSLVVKITKVDASYYNKMYSLLRI